MICEGCGKDKKLVKAHIIPKSFFVGLRDGNKPLKVISNTENVYPKRVPKGIYDEKILCSECEGKFDEIDDYAYKTLILDEPNHHKLIRDGKTLGYSINNVDTKKLKLFFISLLWRASVSKQSFYHKVELGKFKSIVKEMIWRNDPGKMHDFSFVLAKFEGDCLGRTMLEPYREKWYGVNYYRFYLYGYMLCIKVDSRITPDLYARFIPKNDNVIVVSRGDFSEKQEYALLLEAARMPQNIPEFVN